MLAMVIVRTRNAPKHFQMPAKVVVLPLVWKPQQYSPMKLISINILFFYLIKIITAPTGPSDIL